MGARVVPVAARALDVARAPRRVSSQVSRASTPRPTLWFPQRGFKPREFGLDWFHNAEALFDSIPAMGPRPVFVASPYEFEAIGNGSDAITQARRYATFPSHEDYWNFITEFEKEERPHTLNEIFTQEQPRCLYFDLDGHPGYKNAHRQIMHWLQMFVRWFFSGDRLGWTQSDPEPVVLASPEPTKYSCHVVFPQLQFSSHAHQSEYLLALLAALPALEVELEGQGPVPVLDRLVDRVPYTRFQLFRGPYACKLKTGELRLDTRLEPETFFRGDELTCFAGHVDSHYSLPLPKMSELLEWNKELKDIYTSQQERMHDSRSTSRFSSGPSIQDQANLYLDRFQQPHRSGRLDVAGRTEIEQFEACLVHLHPDRASDWYSWWKICGVTSRLLGKYGSDISVGARIWKAFFAWSKAYDYFDEVENIDMVEQGVEKAVSGMDLLFRLVQHDNPGLEVRHLLFRLH